ncbi:MAG: polysaccharide pyruvyl transferase family protein, partial [Ignavibacteria bacterium]|nr:polysaccharide pyruvyl transferase family protein [Ignavibacteria bacterium]
ALHSLIEYNNNIIYKVDEKEGHNLFTPTIFGGLLPINLVKLFLTFKKKKLSKTAISIFKATGGKIDYVNEDIDASTEFLIRKGSKYKHLNGIVESIRKSDAIVVNGEGTFIFSKPTRREALFYLIILKTAQHFGKKTYLVNAMFSDGPKNNTNPELIKIALPILNSCTYISVRDMESLSYIKQNGVLAKFDFIPDALFTWRNVIKTGLELPNNANLIIPHPEEDRYINKFNFKRKYICLGGSSTAQLNNFEELIESYTKLTQKLLTLNIEVYLIQTCAGDHFLNEVSHKTAVPIIPVHTPIFAGASILSNATIFISGRFHPSILASLGGTPCVFLSSNSHKTKSLQSVLEYDKIFEYSSMPQDEEIDRIFEQVSNIIEEGDIRRQKIINVVEKRMKEAENLKTLIY